MTGGHGHVFPRPDGAKARCGGPGICPMCSAEYARLHNGTAVPGSGMVDQPLPQPGRGDVTAKLMDLLRERQRKGIETYGTSLQAFNGRDALRDALEEAIDLAQYLMQAIMERDAANQQQAPLSPGHPISLSDAGKTVLEEGAKIRAARVEQDLKEAEGDGI